MMGSNYRVNFEVIATTNGFDAGMNRINRGLTQIGGGFRRSGVDAGFMSNQLKAIGTTARYYLAGSLVYGVRSAISNLAQFKSQLGEIDALATRVSAGGGITDISGQLNQLGTDALLMSNQFGASVGEVEAYMQRFQTAVGSGLSKLSPTAQRQQITEFVKSHLNLVTLLGSRAGDPNELAGGLAAMIRRMPQGDKRAGENAQTLSNYLAYIVTNAPQLSGANIAQSAGRLASAQFLSKMSMRDVLGIYGAAAEAGGSPSVISRGITQMLGSSLMHPTKQGSLAVYQQAGLPTDPNNLAKMGGMNVFTKLMDYMVRSAPPGQHINYDALYNVFSRQESVRQFANLLANGGVKGLKDFIKGLDTANKGQLAQEAAKKRLQYSTLVRAQNAMTNLGIGLVSGADGPLELAGKGIIGASNFAAKHQTATEAIVDGSLALYATNKLRRIGAFSGVGSRLSGLSGRFGKFGKVLGGAGKFLDVAQSAEGAAASQAVMAQEFPSVLGGGAADGSRGSPYWVIISPFSWQFTNPFSNLSDNGGGGGGGNGNKGGNGTLSKIVSWFSSGAGAVWAGTKIAGTSLGKGVKWTGRGIEAGGAEVPGLFDTEMWWPGKYNSTTHRKNEGWENFLTLGLVNRTKPEAFYRQRQKFSGVPAGPEGPLGISAKHSEAFFSQLHSDMVAREAHKVMVKVEGTANVILDLTTFDAHGSKVHLKKGVNAKLIPTTTYPSAQGKPGSRRGQ